MPVTDRLSTLPLTVRLLLVVSALLAVDLAFAVYAESALAAGFGWPLLFLTALALVVAVLDGIRRLLT